MAAPDIDPILEKLAKDVEAAVLEAALKSIKGRIQDKEALMKAMSFRKEHPVVMTIGKAVMLSEIGNLEEAPTREDMVKDGLDSANAQIELYERLVTEDLD